MDNLNFVLPTPVTVTRQWGSCLKPVSSKTHFISKTTNKRTVVRATLSNVMVVAANRGLGAALANHLHEIGVSSLTTTHRPQTPCPSEQQSRSASVYTLDALDRAASYDLLKQVRPSTVISCVGGDVTVPDTLPDLTAAKNLIDASAEANVSRFIFISALGAGDSESAVPPQVMTTMRPLLLDKTDAEAYLRANAAAMKWTIIRPAPLTDESTGKATVTEDIQCYGTVARKDLAVAIAKIAESDKAIGRTLHVVNRAHVLITAPYVRPLEFWEPLPFKEYSL